MSLKSDDFDPSETLKLLVSRARWAVGEPGWRMCGPEIENFILCEVRYELVMAFSKAESLYIKDMVKQSGQMSLTIFEAVLAGSKLADKSSDEDGGVK